MNKIKKNKIWIKKNKKKNNKKTNKIKIKIINGLILT